jgi:hypothetical protein
MNNYTTSGYKSEKPDTTGDFKNGNNRNYIDGNFLFGKPSTPLVNTGLSETSSGIHKSVAITQEENSASRANDKSMPSSSEASHLSGQTSPNLPLNSSVSRLNDNSTSTNLASHLASHNDKSASTLASRSESQNDKSASTLAYRSATTTVIQNDKSASTSASHSASHNDKSTSIMTSRLAANSVNQAQLLYGLDENNISLESKMSHLEEENLKSNKTHSVLFRSDSSCPNENLRVDSCIDLSTSGNQRSARLAEQRRIEELHYSESNAARNTLSSKH